MSRKFRRIVKYFNERPEDPEKSLFVVKQKTGSQNLDKGIACAVEKTDTDNPRNFLLTCTSDTNRQQQLYAHAKSKPFPISNPLGDEKFTFTPLDRIPKGFKCLPLKLRDDIRDECYSYNFTGSSFNMIHWRYQSEDDRYELAEEKELHLAIGSPVLCGTMQGSTYVVGVVCKSEDGSLRPEFFTQKSLLLPGKKIILSSMCLVILLSLMNTFRIWQKTKN